jgi:hypothetical protein
MNERIYMELAILHGPVCIFYFLAHYHILGLYLVVSGLLMIALVCVVSRQLQQSRQLRADWLIPQPDMTSPQMAQWVPFAPRNFRRFWTLGHFF